MRIRIVLLISAGVLLFTIPAIANSDNKTSIALIADKSSGLDKSPLISLLEMELSQKEGIQLLERAAIDKILEEQQLSATGLLDRNAAIKIGKLLRADAFIILSMESQTKDANDLIRVRVSQTAHGLRLLDYFEQSYNKNPKEAVEGIIKKLEVVLKKINQPDEKLIPIGIVDIHRVQLGEQYKMLERTLPVMLSVRLSLEPQIIMLEREDLKVLLDEKLRTEGEDSKFWNSAILIDGYLQPNSGHLEMHLNLKQASGAEIKSLIIPIEPNEPVIAIAKATSEIIRQLQNSPPTTKWQPELEAEQFYKQGQMLSAHSRYDDAIPLFETAHTLQPQNVFYTGSIFNNEWNIYKYLKDENYLIKTNVRYSELEMAELVAVYVRQIRNSYENGTIDNKYLIKTLYGDDGISGSLGSRLIFNNQRGYFGNDFSVSTEKIKEINKISREIWVETFDMEELSWKEQVQLTWYKTYDFNQVIGNIKKLYADRTKSEQISNYSLRMDFWNDVTREFSPEPYFKKSQNTQFKEVQQQCWEIWLQFLHELINTDDPFAKLYSCIALYKNANSTLKEEYRKNIISIFRDDFNTPNEPFSTREKFIIRNEMLQFMTMEDYFEIMEPLIQKKDAINLIIWSPGFSYPTYKSTPTTIELHYQLLEKSAEIIRDFGNKQQVLSSQSNAEVLNFILDKQFQLRQKYPNANFVRKSQAKFNTNMILQLKDWPQKISIATTRDIEKDIQSVIHENNLWIAFMIFSSSIERELYLVGINIDKEELFALWQTKVPYIFTTNNKKISGISINKEITYVSFNGSGIVEFPGSSEKGREFIKKPVIHNQEKGLPSVFITSMVKFENKLYIAYGNWRQECGLGLYDPQNGNWESLFSSTIKAPPPFHTLSPFIISDLMLKPMNKMFFNVTFFSSPPSSPTSAYKGIWKLDIINNNLNLIVPSSIGHTEIEPVGSEIFPDKFLIKTEDHIFEFDTKSEQSKYMIGTDISRNRLKSQYQRSLEENNTRINSMKTDFFIPESSMSKFSFGPYRGGMLDLSTAVIHNDKLWARYGESQILIIEKGKSFEDTQIFDNNILDGEPVEKFVSTPYGLVGIGKGTVGLIETGK